MSDITFDNAGGRVVREDDPIYDDAIAKSVSRLVVKAFLEAWAVYPLRSGGNPRRMALRAWIARVKEGARLKDLHLATVNYRKYCENAKAFGTQFVMHGATFYGPNERWKDFLNPVVQQEPDEVEKEIRDTWMRGGNLYDAK